MDDAEKLAAYRQRTRVVIDHYRKDLDTWVEKRRGPDMPPGWDEEDAKFCGPYNEITDALLETGIDRLIALHGIADAEDFLARIFKRQAEKHRRSLQ